MSDLTDDEIERLLATEAAATPGEWRQPQDCGCGDRRECDEAWVYRRQVRGPWNERQERYAVLGDNLDEADAALIAAARNALRPLCEEVRRLRRIEALVNAESTAWMEAHGAIVSIKQEAHALAIADVRAYLDELLVRMRVHYGDDADVPATVSRIIGDIEAGDHVGAAKRGGR